MVDCIEEFTNKSYNKFVHVKIINVSIIKVSIYGCYDYSWFPEVLLSPMSIINHASILNVAQSFTHIMYWIKSLESSSTPTSWFFLSSTFLTIVGVLNGLTGLFQV